MHTSVLVGIVLATAHLILLGYVVWMIHFAGEPDWPMYWTMPLVVDLPVSLLTPGVGRMLFGIWVPKRWAQDARALDVQNFVFPLLSLGVVGTAWWFLSLKVLLGRGTELSVESIAPTQGSYEVRTSSDA